MTGKGKILVVDDSFNNLKFISNYLADMGFQVFTGSTGAQAMKMVEAKTPDLVLLDINLPDTDGFSICQKLRGNQNFAALPVIFLTASNDPDSINRAFDVGGTDYITKPINLNELRIRVDTHMKLIKLRQGQTQTDAVN